MKKFVEFIKDGWFAVFILVVTIAPFTYITGSVIKAVALYISVWVMFIAAIYIIRVMDNNLD